MFERVHDGRVADVQITVRETDDESEQVSHALFEHLDDLGLLVLLDLVEEAEELWCNHILSHFLLFLELEVLQNRLTNINSDVLGPLASDGSVEELGDDALGHNEVVVLERELVHHGFKIACVYLGVLFSSGLDEQGHRQGKLEQL